MAGAGCPAAVAPPRGAQQQMRAVSRLQPTKEAGRRHVLSSCVAPLRQFTVHSYADIYHSYRGKDGVTETTGIACLLQPRWFDHLKMVIHPSTNQGPDLQNILRQSYDYLTIMPKLRSTYDGRLIYKTSYEGRNAFRRYDSLARL